jgi:hypothetical protein
MKAVIRFIAKFCVALCSEMDHHRADSNQPDERRIRE